VAIVPPIEKGSKNNKPIGREMKTITMEKLSKSKTRHKPTKIREGGVRGQSKQRHLKTGKEGKGPTSEKRYANWITPKGDKKKFPPA